MKTIMFRKALLLALIVSPIFGYAQFGPKTFRISSIKETTTLRQPSWRMISLPSHRGIQIGTDLLAGEGRHWTRSLGLELGYYSHRRYETAVMLDGAFALGYRFNFGLQPKLLLSAGYKYSNFSDAVFESVEGENPEGARYSRSQFNFKIGVGLEYDINDRIGITADCRSMAALPFAPERGFPFSLHTLLGLGVKFKI